jgi:Zn-finger nucleic acid-binding protein
MEPTDFMGLSLDVCPQCAGIWFDDGELATLAKTSPDSLEVLEERFSPEFEIVTDSSRFKHCPRCDTRLETYKYAYDSAVSVDSCPTCHGVFVDEQELSKIHEAIEAKYRYRMTSAIKARQEFTGEPAPYIGKRTAEETVSGLIHALHHWRDQRGAEV